MTHPDPAVPPKTRRDGALVRISRWLAWIGGGLILFCAVPITLDVAARKLAGAALFEGYEISTYIFAVAVALGYGYTLLVGAHIRVDAVYSRFPKTGRALLDVVAMAAMMLVAATLAWYAVDTARESFTMGARANTTLGTPLAIPQFLWAAGLVWFALVTVIVLVRTLWLLARRRIDDVIAVVEGAHVARSEDDTEPTDDKP